MKRSSGVLMPVSSLHGKYMSGSFGSEAKEFIDFLKDCGFTWWQVLPLGTVDEANSPYASRSAFGGNPYFLDIDTLFEKGLLTREETKEQKQTTPYVCEYERLKGIRLPALLKASKRAVNKEEIEDFIEENVYLKEFCTYMALKEKNNQAPWYEFKECEADNEILFMWKFIQFEFFLEWNEIKRYANGRDIKIMGDMPIYVSLDSSDVWANKSLFQLDGENKPKWVAGVPPDYFSKTGQMWGNPIYDWGKMRENGFEWWKDRIKHTVNMFDGVRIDHFRAIESYYSIPFGAENAKDGKWVKGPGKEFIDAVKSVAGDNLIVAEDLGHITGDVEKLLEYSGFPGMRVVQFAFMGEGDNPHLPHSYIKNSVAYSGTHDNNTLLGYLYELREEDRHRLMDYCALERGKEDKLFDSVLRLVFSSSAGLAIFPVQDLLGFGADTRINTPGKYKGNWRFRITDKQLESIDKEKFKKLNSIYKR